MAKIKIYDDETAHEVARNFFAHHYQDQGIKKWGGFMLSEHIEALIKGETSEKGDKNKPKK